MTRNVMCCGWARFTAGRAARDAPRARRWSGARFRASATAVLAVLVELRRVKLGLNWRLRGRHEENAAARLFRYK